LIDTDVAVPGMITDASEAVADAITDVSLISLISDVIDEE
jgi:hypothetical protein